jgi:hypothetical protein
MLVRRSVRPARDCEKFFLEVSKQSKPQNRYILRMRGAPLSSRLQWKFAHRFLVTSVINHAIFWWLCVQGFGFCEGPNLGFSHRKLTWPLQHCLALPRWHVIYENCLTFEVLAGGVSI